MSILARIGRVFGSAVMALMTAIWALFTGLPHTLILFATMAAVYVYYADEGYYWQQIQNRWENLDRVTARAGAYYDSHGRMIVPLDAINNALAHADIGGVSQEDLDQLGRDTARQFDDVYARVDAQDRDIDSAVADARAAVALTKARPATSAPTSSAASASSVSPTTTVVSRVPDDLVERVTTLEGKVDGHIDGHRSTVLAGLKEGPKAQAYLEGVAREVMEPLKLHVNNLDRVVRTAAYDEGGLRAALEKLTAEEPVVEESKSESPDSTAAPADSTVRTVADAAGTYPTATTTPPATAPAADENLISEVHRGHDSFAYPKAGEEPPKKTPSS